MKIVSSANTKNKFNKRNVYEDIDDIVKRHCRLVGYTGGRPTAQSFIIYYDLKRPKFKQFEILLIFGEKCSDSDVQNFIDKVSESIEFVFPGECSVQASNKYGGGSRAIDLRVHFKRSFSLMFDPLTIDNMISRYNKLCGEMFYYTNVVFDGNSNITASLCCNEDEFYVEERYSTSKIDDFLNEISYSIGRHLDSYDEVDRSSWSWDYSDTDDEGIKVTLDIAIKFKTNISASSSRGLKKSAEQDAGDIEGNPYYYNDFSDRQMSFYEEIDKFIKQQIDNTFPKKLQSSPRFKAEELKDLQKYGYKVSLDCAFFGHDMMERWRLIQLMTSFAESIDGREGINRVRIAMPSEDVIACEICYEVYRGFPSDYEEDF